MTRSAQHPVHGRHDGERGIALIAVLVVLGILLGLAAPFLLSMGIGQSVAYDEADRVAATLGAESARELLLTEAALSHRGLDATPEVDGLDEFPQSVLVPESFAALQGNGRTQLGGEITDLQRFIHINSATPRLLANLLGLHTRLATRLEPDATTVEVVDASGLPEQGFVLVDGEVIGYSDRSDTTLLGVARNLFQESGFAVRDLSDEEEAVAPGGSVLDLRTVFAVMLPFGLHPDVPPGSWRPYREVAEVNRMIDLGLDPFTPEELQILQRFCVAANDLDTAGPWGLPQRNFIDAGPGRRTLRVRHGLGFGNGGVVRIRNLETGQQEFGMVVSTVKGLQNQVAQQDLVALPRGVLLTLLQPVVGNYPAKISVVEPLVPHPVNLNTAPMEVLEALVLELRGGFAAGAAGQTIADADDPVITARMARDFADWVQWGRGDHEEPAPVEVLATMGGEVGPFTGWQDFATRVIKPMIGNMASDRGRFLMARVYSNLRMGRDSSVEWSTAPISFASGPRVGYRAAASQSRSLAGRSLGALDERVGTAVAMPGHSLLVDYSTQVALEDALRLDRRSPWWVTGPVNVGTAVSAPLANPDAQPTPRWVPHLLSSMFPDQGLNEPRFPSPDTTNVTLRPATASVDLAERLRTVAFAQQESFADATDPRGRDLRIEGVYPIFNNQDSSGATPGGNNQRAIQFPISGTEGMRPIAVSAWFNPLDHGDQVLMEYAQEDDDRNTVRVEIRGGELIIEVLGEEGIDPAPGVTGSNPQRTAGGWRKPLVELGLQPGIAFHVALSVQGNQGGQIDVKIDGVNRPDNEFITYLTAPLQPFVDPERGNRNTRTLPTEQHFLELQVEDTTNFPDQGVVRVGLELFEYTAKTQTSFLCTFADSTGGRAARMNLGEFSPEIPVDEQGRPVLDEQTRDLLRENPGGTAVTPEHPAGAAVELYGYSAAVYRGSILQPGAAQLTANIGPFTIARANMESGARPIEATQPNGQTRVFGEGIDETVNDFIDLANPVTSQNGEPEPASEEIASGFSTTGGYALLVQRRQPVGASQAPGQISGQLEYVGGIELIRYSSREGRRLRGIQRAVPLEMPFGLQPRTEQTFNRAASQFVTNWIDVNPGGVDANTLPSWACYVVPISLDVQGQVLDPAQTNFSEFLQILPTDPNATEWVRYDLIERGRVIRANMNAWASVYFEVTRRFPGDEPGPITVTPQGSDGPADAVQLTRTVVPAANGFIGAPTQVEQLYPIIRDVRSALDFRAPPLTRTTSWAHNVGTQVLPCHRFEMDVGNYGALGARIGRNDRVALVNGSAAAAGGRPALDWHTVNWSIRRYGFDTANDSDPMGTWRFQLVGFRDPVAQLFAGPEERQDLVDSRVTDRLLKFPSGELPSGSAPQLSVGGSGLGGAAMAGFLDEVVISQHIGSPLLLDQTIDASATQLVTIANRLVTVAGTVGVGGDLSDAYPQSGGLLLVDGEVMAYSAVDQGTFTIAANGRGLLNTEARGHAEGARVRLLTHWPVAFLAGQVTNQSDEFPLVNLNMLPLRGGSVLLDNEVAHYTWVEAGGGGTQLGMPRWQELDPNDPTGRGSYRGLLRGRFGTLPGGASSGAPVIWFPTRYWDRHRTGADDPESAFFQFTHREAPVFYSRIGWVEEVLDGGVDVELLVRLDGRGSFAEDPETSRDILRFTDAAMTNGFLDLNRFAGLLEARFVHVYKPGALDPGVWLSQGWKTAPVVRSVKLEYEGEGRILTERRTVR